MELLRSRVYTIFSDTVMIALALLIIPVIIALNFLPLTPFQHSLIITIDWLIWIAFFLEFILKLIVAEKRIKWLTDNWFDSIVSIVVILSPILENMSSIFYFAPSLRLARLSRLTRLTRLLRFFRLFALIGKVKNSWSKIDLKVYIVFFLIMGTGFSASFISSNFHYSSTDITWISLFVQIFGLFYAFLISFFVMHVWAKFNSIGNEISKEVNSLRNVYILYKQISNKKEGSHFSMILKEYINNVHSLLWLEEKNHLVVNTKFLELVNFFNDIKFSTDADKVIYSHIIEELRNSSIAQTNLISLSQDKTPKILWILLLVLSVTLMGCFIIVGFENQFIATTFITLASSITGLVVALIFDIDTPFKAGFWSVSTAPYDELKEFVEKN